MREDATRQNDEFININQMNMFTSLKKVFEK